VACRILQGGGGAMMVPVGRLTLVRTFAKSELVRTMSFVAIPSLVAPMLGPLAGGFIVRYFHWRVIFFVNIPIGLTGLYMVYRHLPDYRETQTHPLDVPGFLLFGSGIGLLSYVLEVFGEHTLSVTEMLAMLAVAATLLATYGYRAVRTRLPLLRLDLFGIRTFRASVTGSFVTRLGIGGIPFLFPLLYQVGLGFTPIQSGLMLMPQAVAAMSLKPAMPAILARVGYRGVLISNTVLIGVFIILFATIGLDTPIWLIVIQTFCFGFFTSLQYTSMNTLVYADVSDQQTSSASTIASTMQQMAISFGVATASLATAFFIPNRFQSSPAEMIQGIHKAFLVLGGLTIFSTLIFSDLRAGDGDNVSQHHIEHHG
jgi:MFS family permease